MTTSRFALLVPVKHGSRAKTRLAALGPQDRADLMAGFAADAITAATRTPAAEVHVVGGHAGLVELCAGLDVAVLPDEGDGDLNEALRRAAGRVGRRDRGVAVLLADLPCLRAEDLETALARALSIPGRSFVADAAGTGTTLLAATAGTDLDPRFGPGSAAAHAASGATAITGELSSLRIDVDTTEDLERALRFGVGRHTATAIASLELRAER